MANSPQSRKRARQEKVRRARNAGVRTHFRNVIKSARAQAGTENAGAAFRQMQSTVDKAVQKINASPKKAARIKHRVNRLLRAAAKNA